MADSLRVALLIEASRTFGREVLRGIANYSRKHGPWLFFLQEWMTGGPLPSTLKRWRPDGIIVRVYGKALDRQMHEMNLPTVDVYRENESLQFPYVVTDQKKIALEAIRHFQERGFQNFAFCGYTHAPYSEQREAYFTQELKRLGIQPSVYRHPPLRNPRKLSNIEEHAMKYTAALGKWLRNLPKPVALFTCNDTRAYQVLNACNACGIAVPEEVAVLGVDNDTVECEITNPPLSSIDPDAARVGYEAAALLHQLILGKTPVSTQLVIPPAKVVCRQSTDVIAFLDADVAEAVHYVRRNALQPIDFRELVRSLNLSRSTLDRWFHRYLGHSMTEEIISIRIKHIQGLLLTTDHPLEEISYRCGYKHVESMLRNFKRYVGMTPGEYRRQGRIL
jgi:LacI family transcriptional regulator